MANEGNSELGVGKIIDLGEQLRQEIMEGGKKPKDVRPVPIKEYTPESPPPGSDQGGRSDSAVDETPGAEPHR